MVGIYSDRDGEVEGEDVDLQRTQGRGYPRGSQPSSSQPARHQPASCPGHPIGPREFHAQQTTSASSAPSHGNSSNSSSSSGDGQVKVNVTVLAKTITVPYSVQTLSGGATACPPCDVSLLAKLRRGVATAARALLENTATACTVQKEGTMARRQLQRQRRRRILAEATAAAPPSIFNDPQTLATQVSRALNVAVQVIGVDDPEVSGEALISPTSNTAAGGTVVTGSGGGGDDEGKRSSHISTGAVVGIVLGLVGGAVLLWGALYFARLGRPRSGMRSTAATAQYDSRRGVDGVDPRVILWQNTCAEAAVARNGGPQRTHYPTLAQVQHVIAVPEPPRRKRMTDLNVDMVAGSNQYAT
ncbi:hypothetical protein VOLCADRAFT_91110 [Volvox carteri f. nagariensis]|uniref:Uncharacterized protein n=1 Tax=Volvox carteri f. nagariensis TaxID=3068 RepID=D8TW74_VOLCA|nr:uncharacterized protein VOLCADRAFT_91110 [Volvox carteri f. nagariensis]EFJ48426.1 hypothetical protein VOLCADRAFT_91110 [Volvox carteri f. nagariensis]|eukprot:XP_002950680.1 hypothetical protein VOLCADRAFT_91110 [Volvox carteri f. nagariensis]